MSDSAGDIGVAGTLVEYFLKSKSVCVHLSMRLHSSSSSMIVPRSGSMHSLAAESDGLELALRWYCNDSLPLTESCSNSRNICCALYTIIILKPKVPSKYNAINVFKKQGYNYIIYRSFATSVAFERGQVSRATGLS